MNFIRAILILNDVNDIDETAKHLHDGLSSYFDYSPRQKTYGRIDFTNSGIFSK